MNFIKKHKSKFIAFVLGVSLGFGSISLADGEGLNNKPTPDPSEYKKGDPENIDVTVTGPDGEVIFEGNEKQFNNIKDKLFEKTFGESLNKDQNQNKEEKQ